MKQFKTILAFELKTFMKSKAFVGVTLFLVAALAIVMFIPRIADAFSSEDQGDASDGGAIGYEGVMLILADTEAESVAYATAFGAAFPNYDVHVATESIDAVKEKIVEGDIECAFHITSPTSYTYYVDNLSMYDENYLIADGILQNAYRISQMVEHGIPIESAVEILSTTVESENVSLGVDQMQNFFYAYIMIFALYIVILLYGQMITMNVATEKSSRAMELLITSANPTSMMFGKVIASCIAGLTQLIAVFGSALLFYNINREYWTDFEMADMFFDIPPELLGFMLIFFLLGFFIYAFLFGAVGSTVSKLEEVNTAVTPLMMAFVFMFIICMTAMTSGTVDSMLMKVCSFIPFTSPMAMFTRIALSTVPVHEIVISIAILAVSVFGVGVLSAKIYRLGVLMYGNPPKLGKLIKQVIFKK